MISRPHLHEFAGGSKFSVGQALIAWVFMIGVIYIVVRLLVGSNGNKADEGKNPFMNVITPTFNML